MVSIRAWVNSFVHFLRKDLLISEGKDRGRILNIKYWRKLAFKCHHCFLDDFSRLVATDTHGLTQTLSLRLLGVRGLRFEAKNNADDDHDDCILPPGSITHMSHKNVRDVSYTLTSSGAIPVWPANS